VKRRKIAGKVCPEGGEFGKNANLKSPMDEKSRRDKKIRRKMVVRL
jgi:hypothetical protein